MSILRKEVRLTVFENGMLRKILSERKLGKICKMKNFVICTILSKIFG